MSTASGTAKRQAHPIILAVVKQLGMPVGASSRGQDGDPDQPISIRADGGDQWKGMRNGRKSFRAARLFALRTNAGGELAPNCVALAEVKPAKMSLVILKVAVVLHAIFRSSRRDLAGLGISAGCSR